MRAWKGHLISVSFPFFCFAIVPTVAFYINAIVPTYIITPNTSVMPCFGAMLQLPEAMAPAIEAVREVGADLGIVLDTDVDRSGVVDRGGEAINRNRLIAFLATVVLRDSPGTTIVTDSTTSNGLKVHFALS